jgi:hypothetical protein
MMTTFKVACNDDEVVVMHSSLEGYIKSICSSVACLFVCTDDFKVSQTGRNLPICQLGFSSKIELPKAGSAQLSLENFSLSLSIIDTI